MPRLKYCLDQRKTDWWHQEENKLDMRRNPPPPISLDGDSATIRNFGQNDTNLSRNGKRAVEA